MPMPSEKRVISEMKLRYLRVTSHGTHSGDVVPGNKDVSAVDHLIVKLYQEMQLAIYKRKQLAMRLPCGRHRSRLCQTF